MQRGGSLLDSYQVLGNLTGLCVLLLQVTLLILQAVMLRRYRHRCFLLLLLSSIAGINYTVMSLLFRFLPLDVHLQLLLFQISSVLVMLGAIIGLWGTVSLFRSYGSLHRGGSA